MGSVGDEVNKRLETDGRRPTDDVMKENADYQDKAGLEVRVSRKYDGVGLHAGEKTAGACEWCLDRECDDVTLQEAYDIGAFQRHAGCGCEIRYTSKKGVTRVQNWAGGRESWITEEDLEKRKQYGIEPTDGPARHELVKRMTEGLDDPNNQGIIAQKILTKEYSMQQRHQKYLQHVKGTAQYNNAVKGRGRLQSFLTISEQEAQDIIYNCAGKGSLKIVNGELLANREYITLDRVIGEYYEGGKPVRTRRVQIDYSKRGAHICPVKEQ